MFIEKVITQLITYCKSKDYIFYGTGGSATIKHRCVTHLCGRNAIERRASYRLQVTGYKFQVAGCRLPVAGVLVQATSEVIEISIH